MHVRYSGIRGFSNIPNAVFIKHVYKKRFKRIFDVWTGFLALVLLSPILALISTSIKITSRGPIFYKQLRVGKNGKTFELYKFRSMVPDADEKKSNLSDMNEACGPAFKIKEDPRITNVGRVLRKYSLDELPQLVNVIKGEMSLVGPRPPLPSEARRYTKFQKRRLCVTPGLTCYWQVSNREMEFGQWVALDVKYIKNMSFSEDMKLIFETIWFMAKGKNC